MLSISESDGRSTISRFPSDTADGSDFQVMVKYIQKVLHEIKMTYEGSILSKLPDRQRWLQHSRWGGETEEINATGQMYYRYIIIHEGYITMRARRTGIMGHRRAAGRMQPHTSLPDPIWRAANPTKKVSWTFLPTISSHLLDIYSGAQAVDFLDPFFFFL